MGRGDGLGVGVRPRRTGPAAGMSVPDEADSISGAPRARRVEDGVEEASRMNASRDGGGNWGKDIASREADNLWAHGMTGGLGSAVGNATLAHNPHARYTDASPASLSSARAYRDQLTGECL